MAEILGFQSILSLALPTGVDGTRLTQWRLKQGITYPEFANRVAGALAAFNQEIVDQWGWLLSITEEDYLEYENGGTPNSFQKLTDVDRPDPVHSDTIGHMLPLVPYGRAIGGTKRLMRDMRQAQIEANLRGLVRAGKREFERQILTRIFTNTENALGTSGYDVPFVRGSAGNVDYVPPEYDGNTFTSSHTHFNAYNTGTYGFNTYLDALAAHLQEHGHEGPYTAIVSRADILSYRVLADFMRPIGDVPQTRIDAGGNTSRATFFSEQLRREMGMIGGFDSAYGFVELRATARVPTGHAAMFKSYGQLDPRNPLAVRVHPKVGFGIYVVPETTDDRQYPLKQLDVEFEHGVGVGMDRTNGAVGKLYAGDTWSAPTIS
jgi:hypothetical protein